LPTGDEGATMPRMKLRSPWLIRLTALGLAWTIRLVLSTLRIRIASVGNRPHPIDPNVERAIYVFWHESMLAPLTRRCPARVLISHHADGELIAQVCAKMNVGVVRGSTARGGSQALLEMIRLDDAAHLAITPDGPRGPRREFQLGPIMLASLTGMPIVPFGVGYTSAWRAPSWDRFAAPHPFSSVTAVIGEPIYVPANLDRDGRDELRQHVEEQMNWATQLAEDWAARILCGDRSPPDLTGTNTSAPSIFPPADSAHSAAAEVRRAPAA
jgi:lysophospholipid acyltransferase (LPLAT)-like uncharacterized protein